MQRGSKILNNMNDMRTTKYEQKKAADERAKEIKANIADLEAQLEEAQDMMNIMPTQGWEAQQDRKEVQKRISELNAYLDDERKALSELHDIVDMDAVARHMGL